MSMLVATAWVGYQKLSDLKTSEWRSYGFLQKPIARKIGPNQNDDHVFGGGMDWPSRIFGIENF